VYPLPYTPNISFKHTKYEDSGISTFCSWKSTIELEQWVRDSYIYILYTGRYQLEDLAPAGVAIQLLDDETLQVEGDVGDVEKQQRELIEELRDKVCPNERCEETYKAVYGCDGEIYMFRYDVCGYVPARPGAGVIPINNI